MLGTSSRGKGPERFQASAPAASSASSLFGQTAFCAGGSGRFGETAAEFRPRRFQNYAGFGAQGFGHAAQHVQGMPLLAVRSRLP